MRLLIVGAGGHGKSVAEAALASGIFTLSGFLDDKVTHVWGVPVLGEIQKITAWRTVADTAIVAMGDNVLRQQLQHQLMQAGYILGTVIHPRAFVSPSAKLGLGCAVMAGAVIGTESKLGMGAIVNSGAVVDHHCVVEDYAHLGVAAVMASGSKLGAGAWMQAGSILGYGVQVPSSIILPPGSVYKLE